MHLGLPLYAAILSGQALGTQTPAEMNSEDSVPFGFLANKPGSDGNSKYNQLSYDSVNIKPSRSTKDPQQSHYPGIYSPVIYLLH